MTTRRRKFMVAAGVVVLALAAWALRIATWRPAALTGPAVADGRTRVGGVIHVHTTFSDGGGTPQEVVAAARASGARYVVITDHNNLDARPCAGYRDGVLVIVGTEVSTNSGHVLGLGVADPAYRFSGDAKDALEDIRDLGGTAWAAHPFSRRADFAWTAWDLPGLTGFELLNGDSLSRSAGVLRLLRTAFAYRFNREYALLSSMTPPDAAIAHWDASLRSRDTAVIAGADAHERLQLRRNWALRFPSYQSVFALLRNYVVLDAPLSGDAERDTAAILAALAAGRSYIGVDALAPASEFSFEIVPRAGAATTMGGVVAPASGLRAVARGSFPAGARAVILRDGQVVAEGTSPLEAPAEGQGVWRAEVRMAGFGTPWILSNAIYVQDQTNRSARAAAAAWPTPEAPPPVRKAIDTFDAPSTTLSAEHDPQSQMPGAGFVAGGGDGGSGAFAFPCDLAVPSAANPDVFCALITRQPPDLAPYAGLLLRVRATSDSRAWVQLRDTNPASADAGLEHWYASFRATPQWRTIALPWKRFHSFNPRSDGSLDLKQVRELAIIVDKGTMKPGASVRMKIDALALY